jgi:hypothetical protein
MLSISQAPVFGEKGEIWVAAACFASSPLPGVKTPSNARELFPISRVMSPFEGTRTIIPAPPLLHSNQTPVTDLPRLRAFSLL